MVKPWLNRSNRVQHFTICEKTIVSVLFRGRLLGAGRNFEIENCNRFSIFVFARGVRTPRDKKYSRKELGKKAVVLFPSSYPRTVLAGTLIFD